MALFGKSIYETRRQFVARKIKGKIKPIASKVDQGFSSARRKLPGRAKAFGGAGVSLAWDEIVGASKVPSKYVRGALKRKPSPPKVSLGSIFGRPKGNWYRNYSAFRQRR